jgi:hypothetical protein
VESVWRSVAQLGMHPSVKKKKIKEKKKEKKKKSHGKCVIRTWTNQCRQQHINYCSDMLHSSQCQKNGVQWYGYL